MGKQRKRYFSKPGSKKVKHCARRPRSESDICSVQPTFDSLCNQVGFDVSSSARASTSQAATVSATDNMLREDPEVLPIPQRKGPVKPGLNINETLSDNEDSFLASLNLESTPIYTQRRSMVPQLNEKANFSNCDSNCPYQQLADVAKSKLINCNGFLSRLLDCFLVGCRVNKKVEDKYKNLITTLVTSLLDESSCIMPEDACEHLKSVCKLHYIFRELVEKLKKDKHILRSALSPSHMSERQ